MSTIDDLYATLRPTLRGVSARYFRSALSGLEPTLETTPRARTQLTVFGLD